MTITTDISILGTGAMGAACVEVLRRRGRQVTIWNRTEAKAARLYSDSVAVARSAAEAIRASAVNDHAAAMQILSEPAVLDALSGKVLWQTTTCGAQELRNQQHLVTEHGGRFLGGVILTFPQSVGQPHAVGACAGDRQAFDDTTHVLFDIAQFEYLGSDLTTVVGSTAAVGMFIMGTMTLFFEAAAIARHFGLGATSLYTLAKRSHEETWHALRDGTAKIKTGVFEESQAYLDVVLTGMPAFIGMLRQSGISIRMAEAMVHHLNDACEAGGEGKDLAYLTEALWMTRNHFPSL